MARPAPPRGLRSFPTRRSSDLGDGVAVLVPLHAGVAVGAEAAEVAVVRHTESLHRRVELTRSEKHTSELQSRGHLVCRLLLEKQNAIASHLPPSLRCAAAITTS